MIEIFASDFNTYTMRKTNTYKEIKEIADDDSDLYYLSLYLVKDLILHFVLFLH